jgi:hypothetical protein
MPEPRQWKHIDPKRAEAEADCFKELELYNDACKKRGSPLTKLEKKARYKKCMEDKGFKVD